MLIIRHLYASDAEIFLHIEFRAVREINETINK
jgi:hypothetical protein